MGRQIFINQMQCNFNLRQPKANKPTNIYLVVYLNNKQVKLSTGVKVYPEHWNIRKQQAYVNARLSKLDNNNNTIANDRLSELKDMFLEFKHYLCEHPTDIENSITILRTRIYKNTMTTEIKKKSATTVMKEIIDAKQAASSTKEQQKLNVGKFERYLKENNISDTWESMNLNTFESYQKYLVDNGRGSVTIRNIIQNTLFPLLKKVSKRVDIPFTWYDSNLNSFEFVKDEYSKVVVYPPSDDIFNAFHFTPLSKVKVLILGQDPYHNVHQAHGLSFSVPQDQKEIPPSLQNIYKELQSDLGCYIPDNGYLKKWADQGVLLLNTVLTVRAHQANSHQGHGWEQFTDAILAAVNQEDRPIVYLLWGRPAQSKIPMLTNPKHLILKAPHPSPLSAYRGFFGCRHFSQTNAFLESHGASPIDWQIENIHN